MADTPDAPRPAARPGKPRRTAADPAVAKRICDAVALGATYKLACKYGGVAYDTFLQWRRRFPAFDRQVEDAEGRAGIGWLAKIEKAANEGEWTAAAWKLERRYPETYGRRDLRHSGATLNLTPEQLAAMGDADFERLYARVAGAGAASAGEGD